MALWHVASIFLVKSDSAPKALITELPDKVAEIVWSTGMFDYPYKNRISLRTGSNCEFI